MGSPTVALDARMSTRTLTPRSLPRPQAVTAAQGQEGWSRDKHSGCLRGNTK